MIQQNKIICNIAAFNLKIIDIMKSKVLKTKELARKAFDKMILKGYIRGLALATTKGVTTKNVLEVNEEVDILLRKWRGEI